MFENLKKNIKNKAWWVAVISALILLGQSHGLDLTKYIGVNWQDTLNTVFSLAVLFGISVDTTAVVTSNSTENKIQTYSDSINTSTSSDNSASSKIVVDNPDNGVALDKEVTATTAVKPN